MSLDFPGKQLLTERIDRAVDADCPHEITRNLRETLCELIGHPDIRLPECVFDFQRNDYCRRLLHQDDKSGYTILAMTWAPKHATPVHDHAGMWCVEAVWEGEIEVVQYEMVEEHEHKCRLEPRTTMRTGVGSAGSLIPPHEYHTIANPDDERPAVTLHIYSGQLDRCSVFEPLGDDWYLRRRRNLGLDAA